MTQETSHTICTLVTEIDELHAENAALKAQLDAARNQLATAKALSSRTGW